MTIIDRFHCTIILFVPVNSLVVPMLKKELIKLKIPAIEDKADVKVAKVKYKFKKYQEHCFEGHRI